MKKIFAYIFAALATAQIAGAENFKSDDMQMMRMDLNPATSGKAGACMGTWSDMAFASYGNVAAVPFADKKADVAASFTLWSPSDPLAKMNCIGVGGAFKAGERIGIAVGGNYDMGSAYDVFDEFGIRQGSFKTSFMSFSAGVGVKVHEMLSVGANLRYASRALASGYKPQAFAADAYLMFKWKGLGVTAGVSSVGAVIGSDADQNKYADSFNMPSSATLGVGYTHCFAEKHKLQGDIDFDYYFTKALNLRTGVEYAFKDMLFVRAGYNFSNGGFIPSHASIGLGVKFYGVHLDAAYLTGNGPIKNTISFSLGYSF